MLDASVAVSSHIFNAIQIIIMSRPYVCPHDCFLLFTLIMEDEISQYKVIIVGDGTVGKTSLVMKFTQDYFAKAYKQTIGVEFYSKRLKFPPNKEVALTLWDIGGQSLHSKMLSTYIVAANAVIYVYDITNKESFEDIKDWLTIVKKVFVNKPLPFMSILGNKIDILHNQTVTSEVHKKFSSENNMMPFYVSAKTGDMVSKTFTKIASILANIKIDDNDFIAEITPIKAEIINYEQNDPTQPEASTKLQNAINKSKVKQRKCIIY